jgi:hypothetical protein
MRVSWASLAAALAFLAWPRLSLRAQEPDPTEITPLPATGDPCERDPRCRLERFRFTLERSRRRQYLLRLDQEALALERRILKARPWRSRYNYEVNFATMSNFMQYGVLAGYAPAWWMKIEALLGGYENRRFTEFGRFDWKGVAAGSAVRVLPIKVPLTPYVSAGWGYMSSSSPSSNGSGGEAHLLMLGIGAELVVPYFHFSVGYQFAYAFYAQARDANGQPNESLQAVLRRMVDDNYHGWTLEVGCAF